jgi:putative tryptophan/tyrosine transport system substrate-binding protein
MISRRGLLIIGAGTVAWSHVTRAQQKAMPVIGVLMNDQVPDAQSGVRALVRRLGELGWTDGGNVRIDYRSDDGDADRRRNNAAELVREGLDAITTVGTPELMAAARETHTIPIVFISVSDPVGLGFVASLAHPGGNITGFANFEPAIGGKWLELLKEIAPGVTRVALLFNPETAPFNKSILRSLEAAAPSFAVQVSAAPAHDAAELEDAIAAVAREPGGGLIVGPDNFTYRHRERIIALAAKHHLPAVTPLRGFAASGSLLVYGVDLVEQARRAAAYVDRILKGANPGDLPVQAPTKFELIVNLKTAKALGLTIPQSILARADEVIE